MRLSCVAALCLLLAACASTSTSNPPQTQPSTPATASAPPPPTAPPAATAAPAAAPAGGAGVYTQAQAQRGRGIFDSTCTSCHAVSDFSGEAFRSRWGGSTADEIFNLVRTSMPQDSPGSLEPQQYADVIAFFFSGSGMPAGPAELKPDEDLMRSITIGR